MRALTKGTHTPVNDRASLHAHLSMTLHLNQVAGEAIDAYVSHNFSDMNSPMLHNRAWLNVE